MMPSEPRRGAPAATALAALALAVAGCGSLEAGELPPVADPAESPPLTAAPAGRVVERAAPERPRVTVAGRTLEVGAGAVRVVDEARASVLDTCLEPVAVAAADQGRTAAVLCGRERVVELYDAATLRRIGRAPAGTGPTGLASDGGNYLYVVDAKTEAVLVYRIVPELHPTRRYPLAGGPYAIAYADANPRLWVTLTATNELAELSAGARPRLLNRHPSVRAPRSVAVEGARVRVTGRDAVQLLDLARTR